MRLASGICRLRSEVSTAVRIWNGESQGKGEIGGLRDRCQIGADEDGILGTYDTHPSIDPDQEDEGSA